jgi:hypothetical protein
MPWVRFDDRHPSKREIRKLSDAAYRLHHSAICWSSENLTDGFVADDDLMLASDVRDPVAAVAELVMRELWQELPGGWIIHDFFDHSPSAEQVRSDRSAKTERQQRWRQNKLSGGTRVDASVDASTPPSRDASEDAAPSRPVPSRPVPLLPPEVDTSSSPADADDGPPPPKPKRPKTAPKTPDRFGEFWAAYPRKVARANAEKAWTKAVSYGTDPAELIAAAAFYALERKLQDPAFTKHPATWLNGRCWEDEPDPAYVAPAAPVGHTAWRNSTDPSDYLGEL